MLQPEQSVQNWNFYKSGIDVKLEICHGHEIGIEFFRKGNGRKRVERMPHRLGYFLRDTRILGVKKKM